jgi:ABC-type phosphate transport system substrate-binding protein
MCHATQLAVIVDKGNTSGGVTSADLTKIFKFESRKWTDGRAVVLVMRRPIAPEVQEALQKLCKIREDEFSAMVKSHRASIVFVGSEEELMRAVSSTPGAVGLVDVYSINSRVNVLKLDGKLPLEPGYPLRGN